MGKTGDWLFFIGFGLFICCGVICQTEREKRREAEERRKLAGAVGRRVRKKFGAAWFGGTVTRAMPGDRLAHVVYDDGDEEDLEWAELAPCLAAVAAAANGANGAGAGAGAGGADDDDDDFIVVTGSQQPMMPPPAPMPVPEVLDLTSDNSRSPPAASAGAASGGSGGGGGSKKKAAAKVYRCGRCGQPKKGHKCTSPRPAVNGGGGSASAKPRSLGGM